MQGQELGSVGVLMKEVGFLCHGLSPVMDGEVNSLDELGGQMHSILRSHFPDKAFLWTTL